MTRLAVLFLLGLSACGVPEGGPTRPMHDVVRQELRPTDTSGMQMFRFDPTDVVERFGVDGGEFVVHFTRAGRNRVPAADRNDSGVPDFVEDVARVYEEVGATYRAWGFRAPPRDTTVASNGGDDRFDVYLLDFARQADGAFRQDVCTTANPEICIGYMVQENDFAGYGYPSLTEATRILGSHEFFHAVQSGYDTGQEVNLSEGSAVWATEQYDPQSDDFEGFIGSYLARPDRSLDSAPSGPVPASAYGSAIFFQFLTERYDAAIVRKLWEHLENRRGFDSEPDNKANPTWLVQLDALLRAEYQSTFARAFEEFATWNLYLGPTAADSAQSYDNGVRYPAVMMTQVAAPYRVSPMRVFYASTQYLRLPVDGRASMTATLFDDPTIAGDDTEGMVLVGAARRQGRNVEVKRLPATFDTTSADELVVAVINTARAPAGPVLSKRPGLCVGTPAEVQSCLMPPSMDAGAPTADAGVTLPSIDQPLPALKPGCGCGMDGGAGPLLLLLAAALLRRRSP
jgi:MYXO-CTERM domain-containing protein